MKKIMKSEEKKREGKTGDRIGCKEGGEGGGGRRLHDAAPGPRLETRPTRAFHRVGNELGPPTSFRGHRPAAEFEAAHDANAVRAASTRRPLCLGLSAQSLRSQDLAPSGKAKMGLVIRKQLFANNCFRRKHEAWKFTALCA